jgi:ubiquitin-activating enzyme E1-like protein 2
MKKCVDKLTYFMKQDLSVNSLMDILSEVKIEEFKPSNKVR